MAASASAAVRCGGPAVLPAAAAAAAAGAWCAPDAALLRAVPLESGTGLEPLPKALASMPSPALLSDVCSAPGGSLHNALLQDVHPASPH